MDKITCPSCGASIADDGSAVYQKGRSVDSTDALLKRIEIMSERIENLMKEKKDAEEEDNGEPFSEFK